MATLISTAIVKKSLRRLTTDQIICPEKALSELYPQFTLHNMQEMLWEVFSRSLVVKDNELGTFSRPDILSHYTIIVQVLEAAYLVAQDYKRQIETRNEPVNRLGLQ